MITVNQLKYTYDHYHTQLEEKANQITEETRENGQDQNPALNGVSFHINEGEWVAVCGHNGSGKSTLARLLDGLLLAQEGTITVDNIPLTEETVWDVRSKIGMVFQNPENQFVGVTVEDDIAFGLENQGVPREEMVQKIDDVLALVDMSAFKTKEPTRLSGGQKQRVAIASVLALQPKIIILDEATAMLDPKGRKQIIDIVYKLKQQLNLTVISITHDVDEVLYADRLLVLQKGQLMYDGAPHDFFQTYDNVTQLGLDVPYAYRMCQLLQQAGVPLPQNYLTQEALEEWLCQLLSNK